MNQSGDESFTLSERTRNSSEIQTNKQKTFNRRKKKEKNETPTENKISSPSFFII